MTIDKRAIEKMARGIQAEFDKHPIKVPIHADPATALPPASNITTYNGPVVISSGDHAQIAWNNESVSQTQNHEIAQGYEALATLLADLLASLQSLGLAMDDAEDVRDCVDTVLGEVVKATPDDGVIRKAVKLIKGALAPIATGVGDAVTTEASEETKHLIENLGLLLG